MVDKHKNILYPLRFRDLLFVSKILGQQFASQNATFHKKYGTGRILDIDNDKAEVDFDDFSLKKIYLKFLKTIG